MNHNFPSNTIVRPNPAHAIFHPSPISRGAQQPTPQQYVNPGSYQQSFSTPQQMMYEPTPHSQNANLGSAFALVNGNSLSQPHNTSVQPQQSQNEQQQEIKNLLIFNCKGCREILGDSLSFVIASQEFEMIVLNAVTDSIEQSVTEAVSHNTDDLDRGCSYLKLTCTRCGKLVGKRYTNVTGGVPIDFKDRFCLIRKELQSFEVGTVATKNTESILQNLPTCQSLQVENAMMQKILLLHKELLAHQSEQIIQLEKRQTELFTKIEEQNETIKALSQRQRKTELVQTVIKQEQQEMEENIAEKKKQSSKGGPQKRIRT